MIFNPLCQQTLENIFFEAMGPKFIKCVVLTVVGNILYSVRPGRRLTSQTPNMSVANSGRPLEPLNHSIKKLQKFFIFLGEFFTKVEEIDSLFLLEVILGIPSNDVYLYLWFILETTQYSIKLIVLFPRLFLYILIIISSLSSSAHFPAL